MGNKMKRMILITLALALMLNAITARSTINNVLDEMADRPSKEIFTAFHHLHKKTYSLNSQEALNRYRIFKDNVAWIKAENNKLGKELYGITQFTDMTHKEFVEKTLLKPEQFREGMEKLIKEPLRFLGEKETETEKVVHHYHEHHHYYDNEKKEESKGDDNHNLKTADVDHRKYDNPIRSQGGCGSCWAFAAIGAIENNYHQLTGELKQFSEQYLVDCDNRDSGCDGGWPTNTMNWVTDNGVVELKHAPYEGSQGWCNTNLKKYEYKIVQGAKMFPGSDTWENLLAKGPMVVGMDASFSGFGYYRPSTFEPLRPTHCGQSNHAVVAEGQVTENGEEFLIVRNSWGSSWGYGGYFKITKKINCNITQLGWLPNVVKGTVPDNKPDPNPPKPVPEGDYIELFGRYGFRRAPFMKAYDSVPEFEDRHFFYGVKMPRNVTIMAFPWRDCSGDWAQPVEQTTEFIQRDGINAFPASLAFVKNPKAGCINFYTDVCHKGDAAFLICDDIKDTQLVNFSDLPNVKSLLPDSLAINRISFYSKPNFEGESVVISGASYNIAYDLDLRRVFRYGRVRSVKIHRN